MYYILVSLSTFGVNMKLSEIWAAIEADELELEDDYYLLILEIDEGIPGEPKVSGKSRGSLNTNGHMAVAVETLREHIRAVLKLQDEMPDAHFKSFLIFLGEFAKEAVVEINTCQK